MVTNQPRSDVQPTDHDPGSPPASPLPEGRAWEVEADVLDLARRTVLGATAIDQDRYGPGLRFAGAALEAMAYERRNHDWIESVRALAAPVVAVPEAGEREEKR